MKFCSILIVCLIICFCASGCSVRKVDPISDTSDEFLTNDSDEIEYGDYSDEFLLYGNEEKETPISYDEPNEENSGVQGISIEENGTEEAKEPAGESSEPEIAPDNVSNSASDYNEYKEENPETPVEISIDIPDDTPKEIAPAPAPAPAPKNEAPQSGAEAETPQREEAEQVIPEETVPQAPAPAPQVSKVTVTLETKLYKTGDSAALSVHIYPESAENKDYTLSITAGGADISPSGSSVFFREGGSVTVRATAQNGIYGEAAVEVIDLNWYADKALEYTNAARKKNGLGELIWDSDELNEVAAARAKEITEVYSHKRPNGQTCFTLYREKGVQYTKAAENIAKGFTSPEDVVEAWMNSDTHAKNILNPNLTKVAISVEMDEDGVLYWAQSFSN